MSNFTNNNNKNMNLKVDLETYKKCIKEKN